jgi:hypothetical protein
VYRVLYVHKYFNLISLNSHRQVVQTRRGLNPLINKYLRSPRNGPFLTLGYLLRGRRYQQVDEKGLLKLTHLNPLIILPGLDCINQYFH